MLAEMPLETEEEMEDDGRDDADVLTGCLRGALEGGGDVGVHRDHEVPLLRDLLVPRGDLVLHPAAEQAAEHGRADVADVLLADFVDLLLVREVLGDVRVLVRQEGADVLEREALVLRHRDVPDVLRQDA